MITFQFPWILLLGAAAVVWAARLKTELSVRILRAAAAACLFIAAAGPVMKLENPGIDVVVVCDRSRSIEEKFLVRQKEIIEILQKEKGDHDRVGVVAVGRNVKIRTFLDEPAADLSLTEGIDTDGTMLAEGVATALNLIPEDRNGRICVLSDGLYNGNAPDAAALDCAERGVPVRYRYHGRQGVDPVCMTSIEAPGSVESGAPFQVTAFFNAAVNGKAAYTFRKGSTVVARGEKEFTTGLNALRFRDVGLFPGIESYSVTLELPNDPCRENNTAAASVRIAGRKRICMVSPGGRMGNLAAALKAGNLDFDVIAPGAYGLLPGFLDGYRGLIIENCPATAFSSEELLYLQTWVTQEGGGLLLTGGRNSYGPGGYCRSPVEEVMPVSMEIRKEHRKVGLALGLILDRSGSMAMEAGGGRTKMDLANLAAASSIDLLTDIDTVGVLAVDSAAHIIVDFAKGNVQAGTAERILKIKSMGGGIYVFTGLVVMGKMLQNVEYANRHIILFADAADAEEPGAYRELLEQFRGGGITVSVVALGTEHDPDAAFLKDVAERGGGNIFFTSDPEHLPALFSMDTVSVVRESFIDEEIGGTILNDIYALGEIGGDFPVLGGYNQTYIKEGSTIGVLGAADEPVPLFAFRQAGLGRAAALTFEADGETTPGFTVWPEYGSFFVTVARWLAGVEPPAAFRTRVEREGHVARVFLEIDPDRAGEGLGAAPELTVLAGTGGETIRQPMSWTGPFTLAGEFMLASGQVYRPLVILGDTVIKADPVQLPVAPEFEHIHEPARGERILRDLGSATGGSELVNLSDLWVGAVDPVRTVRPFGLPFLIAAIIMVMLEIAERRFFMVMLLLERSRGLGRTMAARIRVPAGPKSVRRREPAGSPEKATGPAEQAEGPSEAVPPAAPPAPAPDLKDVFRKAKDQAKKKF